MIYHGEQQTIKDENAVLQLSAISVIGDRAEQQDSFGFALRQNEGLIVVCDGMGGHKGGRIASEITAQNFLTRYEESHLLTGQTDMMIAAAKASDKMISRLADEQGEPLNAGSTLVSVIVNQKSLMWCSVGDSRAYLLRGSEMVQLTQDHNYQTVLIEKKKAGLIDKEEFDRESIRGEALISFLGIGNLALIDYSKNPLKLKNDDKILIMSDGLYKLVSDSEIASILDNFKNIEEAVHALELKAQRNAKTKKESRDNMTVVLIKIK